MTAASDFPTRLALRGHNRRPVDEVIDLTPYLTAPSFDRVAARQDPALEDVVDLIGHLRLAYHTHLLYQRMPEAIPEEDALGPALHHAYECTHCHYRYVPLTAVGDTLVAEPCPHPEGLPPFTLDLPVPSGRLVLGNDWLDLWPDLESQDPSISPHARTLHGLQSLSEGYGRVGLGYVYVGNTDPTVIRYSNTRAQLHNEAPAEGEAIGHIDTRAWWVCAMDGAHYERRCAAMEVPLDEERLTVEVEPGLWRLTADYKTRSLRQRSDPNYVFLSLDYVGPLPDAAALPVQLPAEVSPETWETSHLKTYLEALGRRLPSFFGAWAVALSYVFTVPGNDLYWSQGCVRERGQPDERCFASLGGAPGVCAYAGSAEVARIPVPVQPILHSDAASPMEMNPLHPLLAASFPEQANRYWMGALLMFFQALLAHPESFSTRYPNDQAAIAQRICDGAITMLVDEGRWEEVVAAMQEMEQAGFLKALAKPAAQGLDE